MFQKIDVRLDQRTFYLNLPFEDNKKNNKICYE